MFATGKLFRRMQSITSELHESFRSACRKSQPAERIDDFETAFFKVEIGLFHFFAIQGDGSKMSFANTLTCKLLSALISCEGMCSSHSYTCVIDIVIAITFPSTVNWSIH